MGDEREDDAGTAAPGGRGEEEQSRAEQSGDEQEGAEESGEVLPGPVAPADEGATASDYPDPSPVGNSGTSGGAPTEERAGSGGGGD